MNNKEFLQELFQLYRDTGNLNKLQVDISHLEIPAEHKELLFWHYVKGLPWKTVGVKLAQLENRAEPLSERQVHRRHYKALDLAFKDILQRFMKS